MVSGRSLSVVSAGLLLLDLDGRRWSEEARARGVYIRDSSVVGTINYLGKLFLFFKNNM